MERSKGNYHTGRASLPNDMRSLAMSFLLEFTFDTKKQFGNTMLEMKMEKHQQLVERVIDVQATRELRFYEPYFNKKIKPIIYMNSNNAVHIPISFEVAIMEMCEKTRINFNAIIEAWKQTVTYQDPVDFIETKQMSEEDRLAEFSKAVMVYYFRLELNVRLQNDLHGELSKMESNLNKIQMSREKIEDSLMLARADLQQLIQVKDHVLRPQREVIVNQNVWKKNGPAELSSSDGEWWIKRSEA